MGVGIIRRIARQQAQRAVVEAGAGSGALVGEVVEVTADRTIEAGDSGRTFYVQGPGAAVTLTLDAGLPEGFVFEVIAEAGRDVTIQPQAGQQLGSNARVPPYHTAGAPFVDAARSGAGETMAVGAWRRKGSRYLPLEQIVGWGPLP